MLTCVVLHRVCSPSHWCEIGTLFECHGPQLFEILWEGLERFLETRGNLLTGPILESFMRSNAKRYARATHDGSSAFENFVVFVHGTVIGISQPDYYEDQKSRTMVTSERMC